jgi:hypothetical protein
MASNDLESFIARVAERFRSYLGSSLIEAYKLGSLAHGGFSKLYSDIDIGLLLDCTEPPGDMNEWIADAKSSDAQYGEKLSVFWGNPECAWGRLPVIDRLDLLDHGVPLLRGVRPGFRRPGKEEIHREQLQSIQRSWRARLSELGRLDTLQAKDRKPYIRAILYAARLIYTWDNLVVHSNDRAVEYLHKIAPAGLDLRPIDMALACRNEQCASDDVFALRTDLNRQCEAALRYIGLNEWEQNSGGQQR